ncbi:MAG: hypothetical protein ABGW77_03115 [Campylobacterales bacterium]
MKLSKVGIGLIVGALLAFGTGEEGGGASQRGEKKGIDKSGACFLLKVYNQCREQGEREGFAGDKLKCLKFAYGLEEYLQQKLPIQNKEDRQKVARGLGKICYIGCLKNREMKIELQQKCGSKNGKKEELHPVEKEGDTPKN